MQCDPHENLLNRCDCADQHTISHFLDQGAIKFLDEFGVDLPVFSQDFKRVILIRAHKCSVPEDIDEKYGGVAAMLGYDQIKY